MTAEQKLLLIRAIMELPDGSIEVGIHPFAPESDGTQKYDVEVWGDDPGHLISSEVI